MKNILIQSPEFFSCWFFSYPQYYFYLFYAFLFSFNETQAHISLMNGLFSITIESEYAFFLSFSLSFIFLIFFSFFHFYQKGFCRQNLEEGLFTQHQFWPILPNINNMKNVRRLFTIDFLWNNISELSLFLLAKPLNVVFNCFFFNPKLYVNPLFTLWKNVGHA